MVTTVIINGTVQINSDEVERFDYVKFTGRNGMDDTTKGGGTDEYRFLLCTNLLIFRYFLKELAHLKKVLFFKNNLK